jgi:hypothetical protein
MSVPGTCTSVMQRIKCEPDMASERPLRFDAWPRALDRRLCSTCRPIDSRESASLWVFWRGRRYVTLFCTKIPFKDGPIRRPGLRENRRSAWIHVESRGILRGAY